MIINAFLQLSNVLQFADDFLLITQKGLDADKYSILEKVVQANDVDDSGWGEIMPLITDSAARLFAEECIARGIIAPTTVGYENDEGLIAELEWDEQSVVYLTESQLEYKNLFEEQGFSVVSSVQDFEKVFNE